MPKTIAKKLKIILVAIIIVIVLIILFFKTVPLINHVNNGTFTAGQFPFPFTLTEEEIQNSLDNNQYITKPYTNSDWINQIGQAAKKEGWKEISREKLLDGGSIVVDYSKNQETVEIFYKWDMDKGEFESINIKFISQEGIRE